MSTAGNYPKGLAKREAILTAAMDTIARNGYNSATVRQLAESVGLSKTGLVHHFGTKEALLVELLRRRDTLVDPSPDDLPADEVVEAVLAQIRASVDSPGLAELHVRFSAEASAPGHPAHQFFVDRYAALDALGERTFERLQADGQLPASADPERLAVIFSAVIDGLQMRSLFTDDLDTVSMLEYLFALVMTDRPPDQ